MTRPGPDGPLGAALKEQTGGVMTPKALRCTRAVVRVGGSWVTLGLNLTPAFSLDEAGGGW